jgi:hypothetical protein
VHVTYSSQGFLTTRTKKGVRRLNADDEREEGVEAVGTLPLVLHGGFTLVTPCFSEK